MTKLLLLFGWLSWSVLFVVAGEAWPISSVSVSSLIRMSEGSTMSVVAVASAFCGPDWLVFGVVVITGVVPVGVILDTMVEDGSCLACVSSSCLGTIGALAFWERWPLAVAAFACGVGIFSLFTSLVWLPPVVVVVVDGRLLLLLVALVPLTFVESVVLSVIDEAAPCAFAVTTKYF